MFSLKPLQQNGSSTSDVLTVRKLDGTTISVAKVPNCSVQHVRNQISKQCGIPVSQVRLAIGDEIPRDDVHLDEIGHQEVTLVQVPPPVPGDGFSQFEIELHDIHTFDSLTPKVFRGAFRGHTVAIKHVQSCFKSRKEYREERKQKTFDREVALVAELRHPNFVQLFGFCETESLLLIYEFCAGGTCFDFLHNVMDGVVLSLSQQLKMCIDVACAMDYLHGFTPEIIHKDLRSSKIFLAHPIGPQFPEPLCKISDLGLANMKDALVDLEAWKSWDFARSQPRYWQDPYRYWHPPEGLLNCDSKIDVYSYSMILFEFLCMEIPFEEYDWGYILRQEVLEGTRPDLEAVPPDTPEPLKQLMIKCWDAIPRERPAFPDILRELLQVARATTHVEL